MGGETAFGLCDFSYLSVEVLNGVCRINSPSDLGCVLVESVEAWLVTSSALH
jgi:hypothetical protein